MKPLQFLLLLSLILFSCKERNQTKKSCGESPHYDVIAELELENQWFSFKNAQLFDQSLSITAVADVAVVRIYEEDFAPLERAIEDKLNLKFDQLAYVVFFFDINLSDKDTKIKAQNIKAISTYTYQSKFKRYSHKFYKKENQTFKEDTRFTRLLDAPVYNYLNDLIEDELCPNKVDRGYFLIQNTTKAEKYYKEISKDKNNFFDFSSSSYRERPYDPNYICNDPCQNQVGDICKTYVVTNRCEKDNGCLAVELRAANPDLSTNFSLYYAIRNEVLLGTTKGNQYISDYYYIGSILNPLNLTLLTSLLSQELPLINQKLVYIKNAKIHGNQVIIDASFKTILIAICNILETMSNDVKFKSKTTNFRQDISVLEGKTVDELRIFLNS